MSRAVVVWRGPSALDGAPIRVQLVWHSENRKTGDMVQAYILRDDMSPLEAYAQGADASICGDCPLSGLQPDGSRSGRACYVTVKHGPRSTWYEDTPDMELEEAQRLLAGRFLRIGAYGDPAAVPLSVWTRLVIRSDGWTGYTHQWQHLGDGWRVLLMASVDSEAQAQQAWAAGWRTFRVATQAEPMAPRTEIVCPNTTHGVQCADCQLCNGTYLGKKAGRASIVIEAHGPGAKYVH